LFEPLGLESAVAGAESAFDQLPPDGENDSVYAGNDHRVTQRHVDAYFGIANNIASSVTGDRDSLESLAGECAGDDPPGEACVQAFVADFGERVFRRPLEEGEIERYLELYDESVPGAEVFRGIVLQLLMSPRFLYHFEIDGEEVDGNEDHLQLSAYELASRLAYHFWQAPPDAELYAAAKDDSLMTDAGFEAQVERLFADDRTRASLTRFWREWYQLDGFAGFVDTPAFNAFLEGDSADADLYADMLDEVDRLLDYYTFETDGSYRDVLSSPLIVTPSEPLAALYGVDPWDGTSNFPEFTGSERSGLLTRAALLVAGNELTNPIKRGAFVLRSILCEDLHPPSNLPAEALALPEADAELSTRKRFELKTSPAACSGCHAVLNPYGFVLEAYDALGRYRTEEKIYSDTGELENTVPIDVAAEIILGTETSSVANPVEFSEQLAASGIADDCFARQYFRYTYRRDEATGDSCALAAIRDNVGPEGSLKQALRDVALSPSFRQRVIGPR